MKWKKKGHEFDETGSKLASNFQNRKEIYIFGAGKIGTEVQKTFEFYTCFGGFIDNDKEKQLQGVNGSAVISLDEFVETKRNAWIVIAVGNNYVGEIVEQLEVYGLVKNADYFFHTEFMKQIFPILSVYYFGKVYVELSQISVTERCTLRCKKCAHGCGYVNRDTKDMDLAKVKYSADSFFEIVDYVNEFVLIGGEPLLYNKLVEAVEYIGQKYRNKINIFSITTNGTLIPTEELLWVCRKYKVLFRISNYSKQNPRLRVKYEQLVRLLSDNGLEYVLGNEESEWVDLGFDYLDRNEDELELIKVFDECKTPCSEVRGDRFYYCVMARSVSENMKFFVGKDDYLDLNSLHGVDGKKIMLEYIMGYSSKGYLDMCNHCYGAEAYQHLIPAAVQIGKEQIS